MAMGLRVCSESVEERQSKRQGSAIAAIADRVGIAARIAVGATGIIAAATAPAIAGRVGIAS
jgi:hypothetical protein